MRTIDRGVPVATPLGDITVIELDSWMAAPSTGAILADLGARVIKVEPPGGDPMRYTSRKPKSDHDFQDYDFQFDVDNRGKESIQIDLNKPGGIELLQKLCTAADVFMCNLLKSRQEKYALEPAKLLKLNPRLVHATLTGYGTTGPDAWRPGYDVTAFFGRSGLYDAMREGADGLVPQARPAQGDHVTGLAFVSAILAALRLAEKTGEGQVVETSLYESAVWTQATDYSVTAVDHEPVRKRARHEMLAPTSNRYPCGDGRWVVFNMPEAKSWPPFCKALGLERWLEDERFIDASSRYRHMEELTAGVDDALQSKGRDEWGVIFDKAGLIWGPVLGLHEVPDDEQAKAINLFPVLEDEAIGEYATVGIPMRFANADVGPKSRSPQLGEHTSEVLSSFGLTDEEISDLREQQVVI
jgi:crotonobetainyl-CoA:carnitine CoA-transferase CaiB-like acyl-CoA transferase|tara:strand:- start:2409 stop:3647 length:1239 start_codon:yes stop_codon:yes gene_type:complete